MMSKKATLLFVIILMIAVLAAVALWGLLRPRRPVLPVVIHCGQVITRPQVTGFPYFRAALILAPDGTVWACGENADGLLGPVQFHGHWNVPRPLSVGGGWKQLAVGSGYAVGVKTDGTLWGWSHNPYFRRFGVASYPPKPLTPGTNWAAVASGMAHAMALRSDGTLWAWGQNESQQVGDGSTNEFCAGPRQVGTNRNWVAIGGLRWGSVAIQADGSLWHWGLIYEGDKSNLKFPRPARVGNGTNWLAIEDDGYDVLLRQRDGSRWVWGKVGGGFGKTNEPAPVRFEASMDLSALAKGSGGTLGIKPDGTLWGCGDGYSGLAGRFSANQALPPAQIGTRQDWMEAWRIRGTGFGLTADGTLWSWGETLEEASSTTIAGRDLYRWFSQSVLRRPVPQPPYPAQATNPWPLLRFKTGAANLQPQPNPLPSAEKAARR